MNTAPLLEVRGLGVAFETDSGPLKAADGVSFALSRGKTLGLVGESGCGKSQTALSILKLTPPPGKIVSGTVTLDGTDLMALSEPEMEDIRGRRISMIFQEPMTALNPVFTVGGQIAEGLMIHRRISKAGAMEAAIQMLDRVGIADAPVRAGDYPHQMSGGMRQRAMIAMALICCPEVLIADEPTTALDVTIQAQIIGLILGMQESMGLSVLFISHDLGVVSEVSDHIAVMYAGAIVEQAPAKDLFDAPAHPYTRGLIETLSGPVGGRFLTIGGSVPDLCSLPSGCRFSDRCALADDECRRHQPELESISQEHLVACWKTGSLS